MPSRTSLVLFGSETGTAADCGRQIHDLLRRRRFESRLADLDSVSGLSDIRRADVVIFVVATAGQGDMPANARRFWTAIRRARMPVTALEGVQFASFGLGDRAYPRFNWAHRKLHNRLIQLSAHPFLDRADGDEQDTEGINGAFLPWLARLGARLDLLFPVPAQMEAMPETAMLPPEWTVEFVESVGKSQRSNPQPYSAFDSYGTTVEATVMQNDRITDGTHWQDVRHIKLCVSGHHGYAPGDVVAIQPQNSADDVAQFLSITGLSSRADSLVVLKPARQDGGYHSGSAAPIRLTDHISLRDLVTSHLDITAIPRRSFFSYLCHFCTDEAQQERLVEFADPENIDDLYDYTTRPRRSILEVLDEFSHVQIPVERLVEVIPSMKPRLFSLASGGPLTRLCACSPSSDEPQTSTGFELLVAIVKYQTVIRRIRRGVCTRHISTWKPGQTIQMQIRKGTTRFLPDQLSRSTITIGPGTGVAPIRALIWAKYGEAIVNKDGGTAGERPISGQSTSCPRDILFFGCRSATADYFFQSEWTRFSNTSSTSPDFSIYPAFSRDQKSKIYVQDLIRLHAPTVHRMIVDQDALVYICGSAGKMPEAVKEAIIYVLRSGGKIGRVDERGRPVFDETDMVISRPEAEATISQMEKTSRWLQDTW